MGASSWKSSDFVSYSTSKGYRVSGSSIDAKVVLDDLSASQIYTAHTLDPMLNPKNVMRECRDTEEHPNTISLITALDVSGSMSDCLKEVASSLNTIISGLYKTISDIEICIMGIDDLAYDRYPIQIGQFESDIRIAEQLDKIYFEQGGGGNMYESYTAAWYMASRHTDLDCWKRGKKGIIITLGDEEINPYLPKEALSRITGDSLQSDIDTKELYKEVVDKYDLYHIHVAHNYSSKARAESCPDTFKNVIGNENVFVSNVNQLPQTIIEIVNKCVNNSSSQSTSTISW